MMAMVFLIEVEPSARISQMTFHILACDLCHTPIKRGHSANPFHTDRRTRCVTVKTGFCALILTDSIMSVDL